ncbi:MAG: hypothetical protein WA162_08560 [Thermodesulfobacteriota bacterium]
MKTYLEITETFINPAGGVETGQVLKIAAVDKADALVKLSIYEPLFIGKTYTKKVHYCNHDESGRDIGCTEEAL